MIRWILAFLCFAQGCALYAKPLSIHVQDRRDYEILDLFERGIFEEEYGYVLEGVKPISVRNFYALDAVPMNIFSEEEFKRTVLMREIIQVWNRLCSQQDRFVLKAIPILGNEADACGYEVLFIHVPKLREVIRENINLFRYVLGPNVEIDELVKKFAYSNERFSDVVRDDLTLTGIVLGFGSHNSIVGGRLETIDRLSISKDVAPYLPKSGLLQGEDSWLRYGLYYLGYAGGNDEFFRQSFSSVRPGVGFKTMQDEIDTLESKIEELPEALYEKPCFIFGAFKGGDSNRLLFQTLQKAQMRIKSLLRAERRLDNMLEMIGGKKPQITCDRSPVQKSVWSLITDSDALRSSLLKGAAKRFTEPRDLKKFWQALEKPPLQPIVPQRMGASREELRGLQLARDNFRAAQEQCAKLAKDTSVQVVIPNQLFIKTVQQGSGERVEEINRLRLKYVIEDSSGDVLFADNDAWLNLSETIQGFVHGLQGMRVGEKRTLYIHPTLGYGALTTLPPCGLLVAHVLLLDADLNTKFVLPAVKPIEFEWLHDQRLYDTIQESIELLPAYTGAFYRRILDQIDPLKTVESFGDEEVEKEGDEAMEFSPAA